MARVVLVVSGDDRQMEVLERMQVGQDRVQRVPEPHVGAGQVRAGEGEHDLLVLGKPQLVAHLPLVVRFAEIVARGDAGDEDALLGHLARAERLGHRLACDAEEVRVKVRPQPLGLVVGRHADDGEAHPGQHARADGDVRGGDVRADDGERRPFAHMLGEGGEHDARPHRAAAPQKPARERVAPREVVDRPREAGEQRGGLVPVELDAAPIQDVEHLDVEIGGDLRIVALGEHAEGLCDRVGGAAMARSDRGVHDDDERPLRIGRGGCLVLGDGGLVRRDAGRPVRSFDRAARVVFLADSRVAVPSRVGRFRGRGGVPRGGRRRTVRFGDVRFDAVHRLQIVCMRHRGAGGRRRLR